MCSVVHDIIAENNDDISIPALCVCFFSKMWGVYVYDLQVYS